MSLLVALLTLALLAAVIVVVSGPLRTRRHTGDRPPAALAAARAEVEAEREAKYREIREAELDFATGKLSAADFEALTRTLRAEAIEVLDRLAALEEPAARGEELPAPRDGLPGRLEQEDRVQEEHDRKEDRPAI